MRTRAKRNFVAEATALGARVLLGRTLCSKETGGASPCKESEYKHQDKTAGEKYLYPIDMIGNIRYKIITIISHTALFFINTNYCIIPI